MDSNYMEMIRLIIDAVARIFVPLLVPVIVYLIGKNPVKKIIDTKRENIEKQLREHIRGYSDKEQELMDKVLKEAFTNPSMRRTW
jgi:F0F1-type ATP synthase membrane subunit b/b'